MKKLYLTLLILTSFLGLHAQQTISILYVNDNAAFAPNTETLIAALQQTGYSFAIFDAVAQQRSPEFNELKDYDLVLWHTSTDGVGLYFWNGNDQDNPHIMAYLNNGGNLVVMGNDFLYDRYFTPTTFAAGDFVHDYLGTMVYHAQSYGDDGGQGVPQLDLVPGHNITSLNPVTWIFSTLWWADACLPVPGAVPVYKMGPASYPLSNYYASIFYQGSNFATLSMFFDPALIDTDANRTALMGDVINYFQNLVGLRQQKANDKILKVFPSPANQYVQFVLPDDQATRLIITDASGKQRGNLPVAIGDQVLRLDVSSFGPGIYQISTYPGNHSQRFIISR
ncbi:MAG: hypothetical protein IPM52_06570 [Bacteroidetes bacterium]|nr:hypothetical protein [Bacteroidota bacterium]